MLTVIPYCITDGGLRADPMLMLARKGIEPRTGLPASMYERRQPLDVDTDDAEAALEKAWTVFQNLSSGEPDEDGHVEPRHMTPDGGRSLMVGDLAAVRRADGSAEMWRCCSMGWDRATSADWLITEEVAEHASR